MSGHSCCGAETVPLGPALHAQDAVSDKVVVVPVVGQRQVPQFRSCSSSSVVDTPVLTQWLIPMVSAIEISQLLFDKVVFVLVVQGVQFHTAGGFMSSTSLSWRKGWFPWSCTLKTIEIPPVALHVVVDVLVMLWLQVPQVRMVQTMQYCGGFAVAPGLAF